MALHFNKPKTKSINPRRKTKLNKRQGESMVLPGGLVSTVFNGFSRAYAITLREIFLTSQMAAPLCQAQVDTPLAKMAALVSQAVQQQQAIHVAAMSRAAQLLEELDLSRDKLDGCWKLVKNPPQKPPKKAEMPALKETNHVEALPDAAASRAKASLPESASAPGQSGANRPDQGLMYAEGAPKGMAGKSEGGR